MDAQEPHRTKQDLAEIAGMASDERTARIVLALGCEPGDELAPQLVSAHGAVGLVRRIADGTLEAESQRLARWRQDVVSRLDLAEVSRVLLRTEVLGLGTLIPGEPGWPVLAGDPATHPLALWTRGDASHLTGSAPRVAVVGARIPTDYGRDVARTLGMDLADRGVTVLGAGWPGIDATVFHGAAIAGGPAIAVVPAGLDHRAYPVDETALFKSTVSNGGVVVSACPPGRPSSRARAQSRNRLVAMLANAVVVTEGAYRCQAIKIAQHAVRLGIPVGAVPGPITSIIWGLSSGWAVLAWIWSVSDVSDDVTRVTGPVVAGPGARCDLVRYIPGMRPTVSTGPSRRHRALPWFGVGAAAIAALAVFVASVLAPDTAAWWVTALAIGGLGAGVTLEYLAGRALERWERRRQVAKAAEDLRARAPRGVATLLSPHRATEIGLSLLGRDAAMAELLAWCTGQGTPFHLITGPGGVGKTRLADELQRRLRGSDQPWESLFLSTNESDHTGAVATLRERAGDRPVLIVIDYAENRPQLRGFLGDAFEDHGTLRVLMLARQAGNWWDKLTDIPGGLGDALAAGYRGKDLPNVEATPHDVVQGAAAAFAAYLDAPVPQVPIDEGTDRRVLDLTAIALLEVLGTLKDPEHTAAASRVSPPQVFAELLRHEADGYWQVTAREAGLEYTMTSAMRRVLVAAVALLGAPDEPSTVALVERVLGTFTTTAAIDAVVVARWLRETYPAADDTGIWVEPLTPDRVAEHLVVETLTVGSRLATSRVTALLEDLSDDQAVRAVTVLSRAATDPARDNEQRASIRALVDHLVDHLPAHHPTVDRVLAAMPFLSTTMAPTAIRLARNLIDLLERAPDADEAEIAWVETDLAFELSTLGRHDEALSAIQRAVNIYERLVEADPDDWVPLLARALEKLALELWDLEREDEGLLAAQRLVELYEHLALADPERYEPELASMLGHIGLRLTARRRPDKGLPATQRALDIYERLSQADPDRHEPHLASVLKHSSWGFSRLGKPDEALPAAQRVVEIYERLSRTDLDRYEPELADSLIEVGGVLAEVERHDEALQSTQQAIKIHERLSRTNPDRYEHELGSSLNSLGIRLAEAGQDEEAMQTYQHAVDVFQRLSQTDPDRHRLELARALNNLGFHLRNLGQQVEALPAAQRAVELCEQLARANPDDYEPGLANCLTTLGEVLWSLQRPDDALPPAQRAVDIYERLARANPGQHQPEHAQALNALGLALLALQRPDDALPAARRAVDICERLAQVNPYLHEPHLAETLDTLGGIFSAQRRTDEALTVVERAATLFERASQRNPVRYRARHERERAFLDQLRGLSR